MSLQLMIRCREKANIKWGELVKAQIRAQTGDPMYNQHLIEVSRKEFEDAHLRWLVVHFMCFPKQLLIRENYNNSDK